MTTEPTDNFLESALGSINNKKEDKKKKELFKLTSNNPCPNCLSLVKHYASALYCKECKFWIHTGCADKHFVDGKCQQISSKSSENSNSKMPRENDDLVQLTSLQKRHRIERNLDFTSIYSLPQSQQSVKKPEKQLGETKSKSASNGETKTRNYVKRGRDRTRSPSPNRPLMSPLLSASRSPSPDASSLKFQQSNKLINKVRGGTPIAFSTKNITDICFLEICLICGGSGTLYKDLVGCTDCGECFHLKCIRHRGACPQPGQVWRCARCSVCENCGKYTVIGSDGIACSVCSQYYHFNCVSLSKEYQPTWFWECDRCKTKRFLEEEKVLENSNDNESNTLQIAQPDLEPFEEYKSSSAVQDTRRCMICDETDYNEMLGNHLLPVSGNTWVHTLCAMLTSGTFVMYGRLYELQEAIDKLGERTCSGCGKCDKGVTVVCAHKDCTHSFHPLCATKVKGGRLYTNKNPCTYRKEVYLFYCTEHADEVIPEPSIESVRDEIATATHSLLGPPLKQRPRLGEYAEIDVYHEISFDSLLEGIPPKIVYSSYRTSRNNCTRLGALSIILGNVKHGKLPFEPTEEDKSREELLCRIGWKSYRMFWDYKAPERRCVYCCEVVPKKSITKNSRGLIPSGVAKVTVFRISDKGVLEVNESFSSDSPSKIWEMIIEKLNENRRLFNLGRIPFRGGNFYFGFTSILSSINDEEGNLNWTVETPIDFYHGVMKKVHLHRWNERIVTREGSARSSGLKLWQDTKRAKRLALRDIYINRDERSEMVQNILSSYTIGGGNSSGSANGPRSTGSSGSGAPTAISSATFAAISASPALSSIIGRNNNHSGNTDSHNNNNKNNNSNNTNTSGNDSGRRGLIHHDTFELPMQLRYKQLLQMEDDFVPMKSPIQGLGMFALKLCTPESMLLEYRGEIIRLSVGDIREERYRKRGLADYLFSFSDKQIIDATLCGANARFVNHCHAPNCRPRIIQVSGMKHIVIMSKTFINPGEELCYDYNFPIEDENSKIPCNCGAPYCPGVMN